MWRALKIIFIFYFFFLRPCFSQTDLKISEIMKGEDFIGHLPENIFWAEDGKSVYFDWNPDNNAVKSLYRVDLKGLKPTKVDLEELRSMPSKSGIYSPDRAKKVYENNGDIYLYDLKSGHITQLTNTIDREYDPTFTMNDKGVVFRKENNLYRIKLQESGITQLTNFIEMKEADKKVAQNLQRKWINNEEIELFEVLRSRNEIKKQNIALKDSLKPHRPLEIPLNGHYLKSLKISPDERYVVYTLIDHAPYGQNTEVPSYITESGYTDMINARPKVGSPDSTMQLYVYDVERDTAYLVCPEKIPGIFDKPEFLSEYWKGEGLYKNTYSDPRKLIYQNPVFNATGRKAALVIRSADNKDRWIMELILSEGTLEMLDRQRDESWIGGPGIGEWNNEGNTLGWLADDETLWFQSENTGFSHVYTINTNTKVRNMITQGNWEVHKVSLSSDKSHFYIAANKEGPAEKHFYRIPVAGGSMTRYTMEPGNYEVSVSPDDKMLAIRYSYSNMPWELYLMPNKPGAEMYRATYSTKDEFNAYPWRDPEIVHFRASDGEMVAARLYRPENQKDKSPAVIFVHGAGYLQNVHKWWSRYYREYMFHNLLADHGYTIMDIDYRGSEGYGRNWRTGVYRHMGGKDLSDQVDGAKYLIEHHNVDPRRIGIYGGSYGGFITIFAMFKYPEVFKCGAALRSVTDWAHYNHPYTSNRLNTPMEDSIAFRLSSPIYYAEGLQGKLLMLHGIVDTNVHFQDVVRLSQRLIELGKTDWDLAIFPIEDHRFKESTSWSDEYRRIFELFEENLK